MRSVSIALMSILCAALASPASADNDKGKGNSHGSQKAGKSDNDRGRGDDDRGNSGGPAFDRRAADPAAPHQKIVIGDRDRNVVRSYYRSEYDAGRCPPGLAKKDNGCLPPGQAKKAWAIGQPLPRQTAYEPMPRALSSQLTPPPPGYEYVRVADDVVLMSTETRVIAGLLGNLGNFRD